jgi:tellurite resistance protein TerC
MPTALPPNVYLFPITEYWWLYLGFTAFVLLLLMLDLGVLHKEPRPVPFKEAAVWTVAWTVLALAYNYGFYVYSQWALPQHEWLRAIPGFDAQAAAKRAGLEFLAGYIIERALSFDNIFIFVVVFRYFSVPLKFQHRVLFYGILGAFVFRAIFIGMGALLMRYQAVIVIFGAFLIFTGLKMLRKPDEEVHPEQNWILRQFRKWMPVAHGDHGPKFFIRENGILYATPLFVALLSLETTDIVFAIDSVPAIFAVTKEPLIVFTSNIFAILGLRAMYFLLTSAIEMFHYLNYGLALVLVFVGLKMVWLNHAFDGHFPITWSLGIICALLAISIAASLLFPKKAGAPG